MHTILVVDDEEIDRAEIRRILQGQGYTVVEADSYHAAVTAFEQNRYTVGLLISDVSIPGGNGCDIAIALMKQKPDLPVLFVSGHVGAEICKYYGLEVSDERFLRKPFTADELLSSVSQVLNSAESFPQLGHPAKPKTRTAL
jgi:CheY-like chemotaxis protein